MMFRVEMENFALVTVIFIIRERIFRKQKKTIKNHIRRLNVPVNLLSRFREIKTRSSETAIS